MGLLDKLSRGTLQESESWEEKKMSPLPDPLASRRADHPIEEIFLKRWSPRAMSGESVSDDELLRLFEAARWAPSTYNEQEWRFLFARRETENWETFLHLLVEGNQAWCSQAAVLIVVLSHKVFERNGRPNAVHTFDAGAAFENLALQGTAMGLVVHGMGGFNRDKARGELHVPDAFAVDAMIAVGRPGEPGDLSEGLRERESPSGRKAVSEIICEGKFDFS